VVDSVRSTDRELPPCCGCLALVSVCAMPGALKEPLINSVYFQTVIDRYYKKSTH